MKCIYIIIIILLSLNLWAGRFAGDFMEIGPGVRAIGMGGAYSAIADNGSAIYWNSAGIAQIRTTDINLMKAFLYEGLASYQNISFCQPLPNDVTIGVNWTRLAIDDIPLFEDKHLVFNVDVRSAFPEFNLPADNPDGYFSNTDDIFQFAFAKHLHYDLNFGWLFFELPLEFNFGGNIKYIKRKIYNKMGTGTGFDFGFMGQTDLATLLDIEGLGKLSFGLNFQDVGGTVIAWDTESNHEDEVLFNTKVGYALIQPIEKFNSQLIVAYDYDYVYDGTKHLGTEILYKEFVGFRVGYYDNNFSTGMSLRLYDINIDYAFVTNNLGNTNRVGLRINF